MDKLDIIFMEFIAFALICEMLPQRPHALELVDGIEGDGVAFVVAN